jgi:hypothetical protein
MEEPSNEVTSGDIRLIPNPASDQVTVSFVSKTSGNTKLLISAVDGRRVIEIDMGNTIAGKLYQKKVDVSRLNSGIFIVQIFNGEIMSAKKVIIQK